MDTSGACLSGMIRYDTVTATHFWTNTAFQHISGHFLGVPPWCPRSFLVKGKVGRRLDTSRRSHPIQSCNTTSIQTQRGLPRRLHGVTPLIELVAPPRASARRLHRAPDRGTRPAPLEVPQRLPVETHRRGEVTPENPRHLKKKKHGERASHQNIIEHNMNARGLCGPRLRGAMFQNVKQNIRFPIQVN